MERRSVEAVVRALNEAGVRYLVAGGLAVVAHGFVRFTADVDLILDADPANLRRCIAALEGLGYGPRAPVPFEAFADAAARTRWAREKGMTVFSLFSPAHPATEVDLFLEPPLEFASASARSVGFEVGPALKAPFVSLPDLLVLKRQAGRTQDLLDIEQLEALRTPPEEPA